MTVRLLRRFLVFQAFLFWQGGFLFYAAVVVPLGTDLRGEFDQGLLTQRVTNWMNLIGLGWHLLFAWDVFADADPSRRRTLARAALWAASFVLLAGLAVVHTKLDGLIVDDAISRIDRRAFRVWHAVYLWTATAHWVMGLANAWLTLAAWTRPGEPTTPADG